MTTQAERIAGLPAGQQVLRAGKRWRAFWTVVGVDGIRRRRSQRFDSAPEALAHLDAMPRRPVGVEASRRTLRDAVVDLKRKVKRRLAALADDPTYHDAFREFRGNWMDAQWSKRLNRTAERERTRADRERADGGRA
jgi:hypothetical protein